MYNFRLIEFHYAMQIVAEAFDSSRKIKAETHDGRDFGISAEVRSQVKVLLEQVRQTCDQPRKNQSPGK